MNEHGDMDARIRGLGLEFSQEIDHGRMVICDGDDTDLTDDPRSGGFLFGSYFYGPCCAERMLASIQRQGETWNIRAECPPGMPAADWIRSMRPDGRAVVKIYTSSNPAVHPGQDAEQ